MPRHDFDGCLVFRHFPRHLRDVAEFQNGASLDDAKDALFEFASDPIGPVRGPAIGVSFVDNVGDFQNIVRDGIVHGRIDPFGQTDTGLIKGQRCGWWTVFSYIVVRSRRILVSTSNPS